MIKRIFFIIAIFSTVVVTAQHKTSSPYSYFGIGSPSFNGTAENRSMQGLSIDADSIRFNLQNPAALGSLKLTAFSVGVTQGFNKLTNENQKENLRNNTFDYLAVAIPTGKLNFGIGILPYTSVGYKLQETTENSTSRFTGRGGLNKVFLTMGYNIKKNLYVGLEGNYNYGNVQNETLLLQDGIQYGSREKNRSDLSGFNFKLGAQYETRISKKLRLKTSMSYAPKTKINSSNQRQLAVVEKSGFYNPISEHEIDVPGSKFDLPSNFRVGAGIGQFQKWMVGVEYENIGKTSYTNTSFSPDNISYSDSRIYRLGGYYIPNYNDITNYFNRLTFRAGLRYQETGMTINNQAIDEFGISFGLGIPAGSYLSNINLGVEYGQRGTTAANLVKEEFVNIFIGISFNDRWFVQKRYN